MGVGFYGEDRCRIAVHEATAIGLVIIDQDVADEVCHPVFPDSGDGILRLFEAQPFTDTLCAVDQKIFVQRAIFFHQGTDARFEWQLQVEMNGLAQLCPEWFGQKASADVLRFVFYPYAFCAIECRQVFGQLIFELFLGRLNEAIERAIGRAMVLGQVFEIDGLLAIFF